MLTAVAAPAAAASTGTQPPYTKSSASAYVAMGFTNTDDDEWTGDTVGTVSVAPSSSSHSVYFSCDAAGVMCQAASLTMTVRVPYPTTWTLPAGLTGGTPTSGSKGYTYTFTVGAPIIPTTVPVNSPQGTNQPNGIDLPAFDGVFESQPAGDPLPASPYEVKIVYSYDTTYDYSAAEGGPYDPSQVTGPHSVTLRLPVEVGES